MTNVVSISSGNVVGSNMAIHLSRRLDRPFDLSARRDRELATFWRKTTLDTMACFLQSWFIDKNRRDAYVGRQPVTAIVQGEVFLSRDDLLFQASPFKIRTAGGDGTDRVLSATFFLSETPSSQRIWESRDRAFRRLKTTLIRRLSESTVYSHAIQNAVMRFACIHKVNDREQLYGILEHTLSLLVAISLEPNQFLRANNAGDTLVDLMWCELIFDTRLYSMLRMMLQHPIHHATDATRSNLIMPTGHILRHMNTQTENKAAQSKLNGMVPSTFPAMATP